MTLTALDVIVLLAIIGSAVLGWMRGFVTQVLALGVWLVVVLVLKLFHTPFAAMLAGVVGTASGAAVLSLAILAGVTFFGGRMIARGVGARTRDSLLGPIDHALGLGFGALQGLILVSLGFLMLVLVIDTVRGGPTKRPGWIRDSTTYPLLNATSAGIADMVDRRRRGEPMFGEADANASAAENVVAPR